MLLPGATPRAGQHFLTLGYPATRSKVNAKRMDLTTTAHANYAPSVGSKRYDELKIDPKLHIAMSFHHGDVVGKVVSVNPSQSRQE